MKVADLITGKIRPFLADVDSVGWSDSELLDYLNESYGVIVSLKPSSGIKRAEITLVSGIKQSLPNGAINLVDLERNTSPVLTPINKIEMSSLDSLVFDWRSKSVSSDSGGNATGGIESFCYDDNDPKAFFVYPGAAIGNKVEAKYRANISPHSLSGDTFPDESIFLGDEYVPSISNYILFKAYSRDSEITQNAAKSQSYLSIFNQLLTGEAQVKASTSRDQSK